MKPYIPIKVFRWFNKNEYKTYIFDKLNKYDNLDKKEIHIKEFIYIDDNLDDALNKIVVYINNYENTKNQLYYFWYKNTMISHNIKDIKWDGFNINPFLSDNHNSKSLDEDISYIYNDNSLFNLKKLNLVFSDDLNNTLKKNKYYFIDRTLQTYKTLKLRDDKLFNLVTQSTDFLSKYNDKFHRIDFLYKFKKKIILSNIFDSMKT